MIKFIKVFISILAFCTYSYSAFDDVAPGGARPLGMGGAFCAVENAGEGALINPASVTKVENGSVTAMYSPLYIGLDDGSFNDGFFNAVYRFKNIGIFSLNWKFLKTSTQQSADLYGEDTLALTFNRKLSKEITGGLRINYYKWASGSQSDFFNNTESLGSSAISFGLGLFYKVRNDYKIGLALNNVNMPRIDDDTKGIKDKEIMPFQVQAGISFYIKSIMFALDAKFLYDNIDIFIGSEYWFLNKEHEESFACRLGMTLPDLGNGFNATTGLSAYIWDEMIFDYGFSIPITTITSIWGEHRFSISYKF